jgi:hypothetical protein
MKPDFTKMTKEEREAHKANYLANRTAPVARPMSSKDIAKMEARNREINITNEEIEEMRLASRMSQRPSSMR